MERKSMERACLKCRLLFNPEAKGFFLCPKCRSHNFSAKTARTMKRLTRRRGGETRGT